MGKFGGKARFVPANQGVEISLRGSEPAGGLVARMADIPGLPPIEIGLEGAGTLDALRTQLVFTAGTQGRIDGAADLRREGKGRRITIGLTGDVGRIAPPAFADLVDGPSKVTADAFVPDEGPIEISSAAVDVPAAQLSARGQVDTDKETLDVSYDLRAGEPSRFAKLLPDVKWASLTVLGERPHRPSGREGDADRRRSRGA
jgi:translocation and assembly module TamB